MCTCGADVLATLAEPGRCQTVQLCTFSRLLMELNWPYHWELLHLYKVKCLEVNLCEIGRYQVKCKPILLELNLYI